MTERPTLTIFGAGLGGALAAVRLARAAFRVELYERRADPRVKGAEAGRSINLAMSTRGIEALREVGLADEALGEAIPMRGRLMHPVGGELVYQPYGPRGEQAINSISRAGLNELLINAAEREPGVRIHFAQRCVGVDFESNRAQVRDERTGEVREVGYEVCVGADGAFSAVRGSMQKRDRFEYSQSYLPHGYKELSIPPAAGGGWRIEKHALHIWPRRSYMMIALPNADGSFTCTLFAPFEGEDGFAGREREAEIRAYFEKRFPDAVPLMPTLVEDYQRNPVGSLVTVRCWPWRIGGSAVLLGDAAHAIVPFYGQGMNASFEDVSVLGRCVEESPDDLERAFARYEVARKEHCDALAQLALDNYVEMRDKVGSRAFLRKKKWEQRLARWFPKRFLPLYSMVSFSTIPYADAVRRARAQDRAVRRAIVGGGSVVVVLIALLALAIAL